MSSDGSTVINWPDEERRYRLGLGELKQLQDKCDAGPAQILAALGNGSWRVEYVRETIRLGLIGGGMDPQKALGLIGSYAGPGHLMLAAGIAAKILLAALMGDLTDTTLGKAVAEILGGSTSRPSTDLEPSSDGHRETSINAQSVNSLPQ